MAKGIIPAELVLFSVTSASIAGVIMTAILDGKAGLNLMFKRVLLWRTGIGYWLLAILFIALAFLLGSIFNPFFEGDPISFSRLRPGINFLPMFALFVLGAGFGQELGEGGYIVIQTNGYITEWVGNMFIFSIWEAEDGVAGERVDFFIDKNTL